LDDEYEKLTDTWVLISSAVPSTTQNVTYYLTLWLCY